MENSLVLSHLPGRYSHHEALKFLKERDDVPAILEIADALCAAGVPVTLAWNMLDSARRAAGLTTRVLGRFDIHAVDFWSAHYPLPLRTLERPPWVLFFRGQLPSRIPTLAIVGTRRPNGYGIEVLCSTVPKLKTDPLQIVSGLAYGIDSAAHFYACETGIRNFAVLGSGIDVLYPPDHAELAHRIVSGGGGLLSEFPPGTRPLTGNFPRRNRIISGLADVIWVVQGAAKSGSLHTVKHALDLGKTVATTPGDIFSELSELPHRLLFEGAHSVTRPDDLDLLLIKS